jgi:hypothetical protein
MPQKPKSGKTQKEKGFTLRTETDVPASLTSEDPAPAREAFENLGELPHGYGEDTIFLIAQEPHWLFTYWDIDIAKHPGGAAFLRYYRGVELEGEIEVPFETRNWYVPVREASADYYLEIGFYRGKVWNLIARSVVVTTPSESMASSEEFDYATIPFHLSFQRLIDNLESAVNSGEDLLSAVSRLQQEGDFSAFGNIAFPDLLSEQQRELLRSLLGADLVSELSSGSLSSSEVETRLRDFLAEHLSSGAGASELLSSFRDTGALFSGSSIFSGGALFSSGALFSGGAGAFSSETASTSWGGASLASWAAALGSSWGESLFAQGMQTALASWSQAATSSWSVRGESSGSLTAMSSWLSGVQSSWAQAALSSWTSAEVSSWFSAAATTSWSGASENLSSSFAERGFFMHVNAEVIFYGGTDPRAKVTIDGKPVALDSNGNFRYHFVFPNADYEIPILAESPDGVETRSATLQFHRATGKVGVVTDTAQPPLGEPMGRTDL